MKYMKDCFLRTARDMVSSKIMGKVLVWGLSVFTILVAGCTKDDEVRFPEDIIGVWTPGENLYLEFAENNSVYHLDIESQDGESIGKWTRDVYYYEPGYQLVVYLSSDHDASVYQIVEMTQGKMTWCWVENIDTEGEESIGQIIGHIINQAQEGFKLDPALNQTFTRISKDKFYEILEGLDITYPW